MATQSQIAANRNNAQKSTGPRTAEGKATVAKNATKHGLFARPNVVISEHQADFDALRDEMLAELAPAGTMESVLAERIVSLTWRLKRAERMQNELIDVKIRREINDSFPELSESLITGKPCDVSKYFDKCYDDLALGYVAMCDFAGSRALERLSLYERRFEASLFRTIAEFKKLRQARIARQADDAETKVGTCRGQDARETQGRDALATVCQTQGRDALATVRETQGRDALATGRETQGQDALATGRETQGRDALATVCQTQGRDALATGRETQGRDALATLEKQSQFGAGREELSAFKKREYELLLGAAPTPNKANNSYQKTEDGGQKTEKRRRMETLVCRY